MSLNALFTGSSALQANSNVLDVVGNNLANLNTTGFKAQRVQFKDLLYQSLATGTSLSANIGGTNPQQIGFGVAVGAIDTMFQQGSSTATGRELDASIQGNGFFTASDGVRNVFTRSGSFTVDTGGFLVDSNTGFRLQRFGSSGEGSATVPAFQTVGNLNIKVPFGATAPGLTTTTVNYQGNLAVGTAIGEKVNTAIQVFDSQSTSRAFTLDFTKVAPNTFTVSGSIGGGTVSFPNGNTVTFDSNGLLVSPGTLQVDLAGLPSPQSLSLNLGTPGQPTGLTQFGGPSTAASLTQDGSGAGTLSSINIDPTGILQGIFTNGRTIPIAQLAVASFNNISGLNREGNNYFSASSASGDPLLGAATVGGRGSVQRGTLEGSNVDISIEFSRLIIAQRGFQVNTRTVTAANEILQDLANIIR